MSLLLGTSFGAPVKKLNNQFVTNKVLYLGLPIAPLNTMFVIEKTSNGVKGFEIKGQYSSFFKLWVILLSVIGAWFGFIVGFVGKEPLFIIVGVIFLALFIGSFFMWKVSETEKFIREQFYKTLGTALMPEWLLEETFDKFFLLLQDHYKQQYSALDWGNVVKNLKVSDAKFPLAFCLTYMKNIRNGNKLSNKNLVEIWQH
ncbi:MAG: hypothetical protein LBS69_08630 [Prevotellaceae bacterium]|jgi:hypothetical protein|nr:hypothetical protein [Prevotellaceae bacterium]